MCFFFIRNQWKIKSNFILANKFVFVVKKIKTLIFLLPVCFR